MSKKDVKVNKEKKGDKKNMEEEPFIIRREVILKDEKQKSQVNQESKTRDTRSDLGKVQKKSGSQDYNIVYRDRKEKPLSVSELFGLKPKQEEKREEKPKTKTQSKTPTKFKTEEKNYKNARKTSRTKDFDK